MRHVVQRGGEGRPITLTVHKGVLSGVVFIDAGGYEDLEIDVETIPALIQGLQAIYTETISQEDS